MAILSDVKNWELPIELLLIEFNENLGVSVTFSLLLIFVPAIWFLIVFFRRWKTSMELVELEISLGNVGKVRLQPNFNDIRIAHKIWTELVTRKAAIKIDVEHDVIMEVYGSWYSLFERTRNLIADIPAEQLRKEESTKQLVEIATQTLNEGLRPHLTRWQARFRNWYSHQEQELTTLTPQEVQKNTRIMKSYCQTC